MCDLPPEEVEEVTDGLIMLTPLGVWRRFDRAAQRLLGMSGEQFQALSDDERRRLDNEVHCDYQSVAFLEPRP